MNQPVLVMSERGETALVQWHDGERLRRAYVPSAEVVGGHVEGETLAQGIQVGADWETLGGEGVTARALAEELRRVGVWTADDLHVNWRGAEKAACKVGREVLLRLLREAT